ncbi:MAG: hypothetical protein EON54_27595, partial [Alcaligenaceae bacterium]
MSHVVGVAGSFNFLNDIKSDLDQDGILAAVHNRQTAKLFDWLMTSFSYQGISDRVARQYIERNGQLSWDSVAAGLSNKPCCSRLRSHWQFDKCRYDKLSRTCSEPELIAECPLPQPSLRNGRLNQMGYSLFLFIRDVASGDMVGWIDRQLAVGAVSAHMGSAATTDLEERLIAPLRYIFGVSDKILKMSLSTLLIGASLDRPVWLEVGKSMIVVDSLVHNFLHRTGILSDCGKPHAYGSGCYTGGGCAE